MRTPSKKQSSVIFLSLLFISLFLSLLLVSCSSHQDESTSSETTTSSATSSSSVTPTPTPSTTTIDGNVVTTETLPFDQEVSNSILNAKINANSGNNEYTAFSSSQDWTAFVSTYTNSEGVAFELKKDGEMEFVASPETASSVFSVGSKYCINPKTNVNALVTGAKQSDEIYSVWASLENQVTGLALLWGDSPCEDLNEGAFAVIGLTPDSSMNCRETNYDEDYNPSQTYKTITNNTDSLWINLSTDIAFSCDFYKPSS